MKALHLALVAGVAAIGSLAAPAFADNELSYLGYQESNSYILQYQLTTATAFPFARVAFTRNNSLDTSAFGFTATTSSDFETPTVLSNFDVDNSTAGEQAGGWTQASASSSAAVASSATQTNVLNFSMHLTGDATDGVRFSYIIYSDTSGTQVLGNGIGYFKVDGNNVVQHIQTLSIVPVPAAFWCGLFLMGGLGGAYALKRRQRVLA